jgi:hypothetical protein
VIRARVIATVVGIITLLVLLLVALPEALGDRPYNVLGH